MYFVILVSFLVTNINTEIPDWWKFPCFAEESVNVSHIANADYTLSVSVALEELKHTMTKFTFIPIEMWLPDVVKHAHPMLRSLHFNTLNVNRVESFRIVHKKLRMYTAVV